METMLGWTFISWERRREHGNNVRCGPLLVGREGGGMETMLGVDLY